MIQISSKVLKNNIIKINVVKIYIKRFVIGSSEINKLRISVLFKIQRLFITKKDHNNCSLLEPKKGAQSLKQVEIFSSLFLILIEKFLHRIKI